MIGIELRVSPKPPEHHALHYLPDGASSLLDIGCNVGDILRHANELGVSNLYGIEINDRAVQTARQRLADLKRIQIVQGSADALPFENQSVDVVTCLEVLEHLPKDLRKKAIQEMHRVLRPYGTLILSIPVDGAFAFLDPANFRFRFPKLFQFISQKLGGVGRDEGYQGQKHGVVEHHHFVKPELAELLQPEFQIQQVRWRGALFAPVCNWLQFPFYRKNATQNKAFQWIRRLEELDMSWQFGERLAYNALIVARKS